MPKVLIIEDHDPDVRQCLQLFTEIGIESFKVVTGADHALDYLQSVAEGTIDSPRLIVLDLQLGNGSGFEILRYWKASRELSNIPVIVWTAAETKTEHLMCKMFGVNACVQKRFGNSALLEAVSKLRVESMQ